MDRVKGIVSVALGAACYGILATIVQFAYGEGAHTSLLSFIQYLFGAAIISLIVFFVQKKEKKKVQVQKKSKMELLLYGIPLGLTSCFYYLTLRYVPVSITVILLMQSIWMGVVWEMVAQQSYDKKFKIIGSILVLLGTLLAVNVFNDLHSLDWRGIVFGLLSAVCYTFTINATNKVATHLPNLIRSQYLVTGSLITIILFWNYTLFTQFNLNLFFKYGLVLSILGTILPIYLFTTGFPKIGLGLGSIISSIEIPVAVISSYFILHEVVQLSQWIGVLIIMSAIVLINLKQVLQRFKRK